MVSTQFSAQLLSWHQDIDRYMPWKDRTDAYAIWLSEIILQQTRMEQGLPYYLRFLDTYPTVHHLAQADEQEVMKLWQGLGYYSRARNLHFTAKYISQELNGQFPNSYEGLLALKGVGPYTAAAIASFAFQLPHAVVDGNVFRVLARYTTNFLDIGSSAGKKEFTELANQLLDKKQPAAFNQAIMDLGATVCKPSLPDCNSCPLSPDCQALAQNIIANLPVKRKKTKRKTRYFYYFVFRKEDTTWIQKRTAKDIWQSLYEFPHLESPKSLPDEVVLETLPATLLKKKDTVIKEGPFIQLLTHQKIIGTFYTIPVSKKPLIPLLISIKKTDLKRYPFPKMITNYKLE